MATATSAARAYAPAPGVARSRRVGPAAPQRAALTRARAAERWRGPSADEETAAGGSGSVGSAAHPDALLADARLLTHDGKKRIVVTEILGSTTPYHGPIYGVADSRVWV